MLSARMLSLVVALLGVAGVCCLGGCARGNIYKAHSVPKEFLAPKVENVQTIDLSRLATYSVSNELIDRGDVLEVTISGGYSSERENTSPVRVADDGSANVPLVGRVELAGIELQAAEQAIAAAGVQRGVFRNPHVTVTMKRQRVNRVTVLGAVKEEGVYELPRSTSSLLGAIVEAGGLAEDAGTEVEIRRPERVGNTALMHGPNPPGVLASYQEPAATAHQATSTTINLSEAAAEGGGGYYLEDGDVVMVVKRDPQPVQVLGLVREPGQYELPVNQDLRVLDALALAKGWNSPFANKVHVIRQIPGQPQPVVIQVSLREAKLTGNGNLRLAPGDIVSVEQTPSTALYEALSGFMRFGLSGSVPLF